jgi:hypothetical protein
MLEGKKNNINLVAFLKFCSFHIRDESRFETTCKSKMRGVGVYYKLYELISSINS